MYSLSHTHNPSSSSFSHDELHTIKVTKIYSSLFYPVPHQYTCVRSNQISHSLQLAHTQLVVAILMFPCGAQRGQTAVVILTHRHDTPTQNTCYCCTFQPRTAQYTYVVSHSYVHTRCWFQNIALFYPIHCQPFPVPALWHAVVCAPPTSPHQAATAESSSNVSPNHSTNSTHTPLAQSIAPACLPPTAQGLPCVPLSAAVAASLTRHDGGHCPWVQAMGGSADQLLLCLHCSCCHHSVCRKERLG